MDNFIGFHAEMELTVGPEKESTEATEREKKHKNERVICRKFVFKKSNKKNFQSQLFLSPKFVNSLKKVGLRKKKRKLENNNFLYQGKRSSLINDEDFQMVKDLPLIPFSPNQLPNFSQENQSCTIVKNSFKLERRLKHCNLVSLLSEARTELDTERRGDDKMNTNNFLSEEYVHLSGGGGENLFSSESDYVDMNPIIKILN